MLNLVAGAILVEVRAGGKKGDHLIWGHIDLQEEADQSKPGAMS
jgi:hypothetical protein